MYNVKWLEDIIHPIIKESFRTKPKCLIFVVLHEGEDLMSLADTLGVGSVVVYQLLKERQEEKTFSWDEMFDHKTHAGYKLQLGYARLCRYVKQ